MEDNTLEKMSNENFKENIEASRYILAGTPEIAMHIMSTFSLDHMILIRRNCKLLLKKTSRMSAEQVVCLRSKITIIDILTKEQQTKN